MTFISQKIILFLQEKLIRIGNGLFRSAKVLLPGAWRLSGQFMLKMEKL